MAKSERIGFIGVGHMGHSMCSHLVKAGYAVTIYDLKKENAQDLLDKGAAWANSAAELAKISQVVVTTMPGPVPFEAVAMGSGGVLENLPKGGALLDLTTNSPVTINKAYERGKELGVDVLDAAMSGGVHGAASRRLTLMVGGQKTVYEKYKEILETMSDNVVYCGASGTGDVSKIVNNLISLAVSSLIGEALVLGVKYGADLETLVDTIAKSSGGTWRMNESFRKFLLKGNLQPGFALTLALKDVRLAKSLADNLNLDLPFLNLAEAQYAEAQEKGWGNLHSEAVVKLTEEKAGVELRIPEKK